MPTANDVILGALKLNGLPECNQFSGWEDLLRLLPSLLSVEIPVGITNVSIGLNEPSSSEIQNLWVRTDGSGSFVGFYLYMSGSWQQIYPAPNQIFHMYGDSRVIPAGYTLASSDPNISSGMLAILQKSWAIGGTSPTWYTIFDCTYTGF